MPSCMGPSIKRHSKLSALGDDNHASWSGSLLKDLRFILVTGLHALFVGFPLATSSPSITRAYLSTWAFYSEQEQEQEQAQGWVFSCCLGFFKKHRLSVKFSGSLEEDQVL